MDLKGGLKHRRQIIEDTIAFLEMVEITGSMAESLANCLKLQRLLLEQAKGHQKSYNAEVKKAKESQSSSTPT